MTTKAQLLVAAVTVATLVFILRMVRQRQLQAKYSILWLSTGLAMAVLALSPRTLDRVARLVGIAYPPTVLFLLAIALLLLVVVHFSWELSRLEDRTRSLAEELALIRIKEGVADADIDMEAEAAGEDRAPR